jgi:hypothetical protein
MRDPLPVIRKVYRQHAGRPEVTASFLADQAMQTLRLAPDDPERERYRAAAAAWLRHRFSGRGMTRRAT